MMDEKDKPKSGWKDTGLKVGDTITFKGVILARYPPVIETKRIGVARKLAPNVITREEASDIAKETGGDPEVWDRLFGVTSEAE